VVSGTLPTLFRAHTLNEILTGVVEPAADTAAESDCEKFLHDIVNGDVTPFRDDPGFAGKLNRSHSMPGNCSVDAVEEVDWKRFTDSP